MNTKEAIIKASRDFLALNTASHLVRWVMVVFLLFCGVPQKTVAAITNYIIGRSGTSGIGLRTVIFRGKGRSGAKEEDKKADDRGIVKYIVDHPPFDARRRSGVSQGRIQARGVSEDDRA